MKQNGNGIADEIPLAGGYQGVGTNLAGERWKDYVQIAPLEGPEGLRYAEHNTRTKFDSGFSITDIKSLNSIFIYEGSLQSLMAA